MMAVPLGVGSKDDNLMGKYPRQFPHSSLRYSGLIYLEAVLVSGQSLCSNPMSLIKEVVATMFEKINTAAKEMGPSISSPP
jgi:hypothetical protein